MRQSLSHRSDKARADRGRRAAAITIWIALAASALMIAVTVIDQVGAQSLYEFTDRAYAAHDVVPEQSLVYGILYAVNITIALIWAAMLLISKLRGWWAALLSAAATLVTGSIAIALLTVSEYGERVFSPAWGLMAIVPTVLGVAATVLLARRARR